MFTAFDPDAAFPSAPRTSRTVSSRQASPLPPQSLSILVPIVLRFEESVFEFDPAFKLVSIWSSNVALSFRYRSRLLGQTLTALFSLPASRFFAPHFRRLRPGQTRSFEFSIETGRSQNRFAAELHRSRLFRHEPSRFVLRLRDLTAQSVSDARRFTSQRLLHHAEENAEFATWEYVVATGEIVCSKNSTRLFGVPVTARPVSIEAYWRDLNFKHVDKLRASFEAAIRSGRVFRFSEPYTRPDGSIRILDGVGTPVTDSNGKVVRMIGLTRDITALAHTQADLRRLSYQLLTVRTEEQRRIGRELHETTSQTLAGLKMTLAEIGRRVPTGDRKVRELLRASSSFAAAAVREVRFVSSFLHPPLLEETGLATAVTSYSKLFAERGRIAVAVHIAEDFGRLEKELELVIFRIVQEALTNVHRHARATAVTIRIERGADSALVEVQDNGIGLFHVLPDPSGPRPLGVGIAGLRERVAELQGQFDILSSPGSGTTLRAAFPIVRKENYYDHVETVAQGSLRRQALPHSRRRRPRHRASRRSRSS